MVLNPLVLYCIPRTMRLPSAVGRVIPCPNHDRAVNRTRMPHRPRHTVLRCLLAALAVLLLIPGPAPAAAQARHLSTLGERLGAQIAEIAGDVPGVMGIAIVDLTSGERFGVHDDLVFPQGSSIKIPILVELYRQADAGELRLDEGIRIRRDQMVGGSGLIQRFGDGTSELSLRDLAVLMIVISDNTATNLLIERVGMDRINATMAELGAPQTRVQRTMIRPADSAAGRENISTPNEAADLMVRIANCELPMSGANCEDMRSILEIPKANPGSIPGSVTVAWKGGSITGVRAGWGIVNVPGRPFAIAMMVNYSDSAPATEALGRVTDAAYDHFRRIAGATPHGTRVPLRYLDGSEAGNRE